MVAKRDWFIDARDYQTDEEFRHAVAAELASFELIGHRIGLALTAAPVRMKIDNSVLTVGWQFQTNAVPLVRQGEAPVAPPVVEEPEAEPVVDEEAMSGAAAVAAAGADPYAE
jgi:hypothetical protein